MLKILHARLQQYMNQELPDVHAGFRKAEEPGIKLPTSVGSYGEGDGTPLQYFCLENPMDTGAWKAAVHGVTEGRT